MRAGRLRELPAVAAGLACLIAAVHNWGAPGQVGHLWTVVGLVWLAMAVNNLHRADF